MIRLILGRWRRLHGGGSLGCELARSCEGAVSAAFLRKSRLRQTLPTALAAPVLEGMMLAAALRPPRQSFFEGPSTVF